MLTSDDFYYRYTIIILLKKVHQKWRLEKQMIGRDVLHATKSNYNTLLFNI